MPEPMDYYTLLGVSRDATPEEIRRAYLRAAQRLHPDRNVAAGETEMFLDVQRAYETLSNPRSRAEYDATLPPEPPPGPLECDILYSRGGLLHTQDPQLIYALLEVMPRQRLSVPAAPPLNVCLVLDRSTSMQGQKMDVVKATALQIMRDLRPQDILSVVAFSDRAEVLIPAASNVSYVRASRPVQMLQTGGATEILQGLQAGLQEVRRSLDGERVNHLILLTDGHTYGDEAGCLALASEAAAQGIGISALGIGEKWNDRFLDELAARTGGSSIYVSAPQEIQRLLAEKFQALARAFASDLTLDFQHLPGVQLSYAFRLQPEAGMLSVETPLRLGSVLQDGALQVLFEFMVHPSALDRGVVLLLDGTLRYQLPGQPLPGAPLRVRLQREVLGQPPQEPPPTALLNALSRLTLYRMQERARLEVEAGEFERAARRLDNLASHLLTQGERGLAQTALLEAQRVRGAQALSEEGSKDIKYGTRALLQPGAGGKS